MPVIDADTHLDETEATWEFGEPGEEQYMPTTGYPSNPDPSRAPTRSWLLEGRRQQRISRDDSRTYTTAGMRELSDVPARLRAMDGLGVDVQVIYPTLFLVEGVQRPEVDLAVRRSYNRWLADRCGQSGGRLRWVCLPPYRNIDKAVEELRFAKDHGACGVLKKGNDEADHWVGDEYFFPVYEEAEKLGMPICFHTGSGIPDFSPAREFPRTRFLRMGMPVPNAFESLISFGLTKQFARLRFGFIEAGSSWVPFLYYYLKRRNERLGEGEGRFGRQGFGWSDNLLHDNRMYVTCQVDEDLPYILKYAGEDNLMIGSDFVHGDSSTELHFVDML